METINKSMFVFQTDSDIVRNVYDSQHNYLIEYNEQCKDKTYCAVYFAAMIYIIQTLKIFSGKGL